MTIHYRKLDGGHGEARNVGELRRLADSGEILRDSQIYDALRGAWLTADKHPMTRAWFPPDEAATLPASQAASVLSPSPPQAPVPLPRIRAAASPPSRSYWKLGFIPALFLLGQIAYKLAGPHLPAGASALLDISGLAVALGTLLGASVLGLVFAFSRGSRQFLLAGASVLPLVAFALFVWLLYPGSGKPREQRVPPATSSLKPAPTPLSPVPARSAPAQIPVAAAPAPDLDRLLSQFKASLDRDQAAFTGAVTREDLANSFRSVSIRDVNSIRSCRAKLSRVSALMDEFVKKVEAAFDLLAAQVETPLSGKAKEQTDLEFKIAKEMALGDIKDFFKLIKQYNSDADRMLSFMEGLSDVDSASNADILTLKLYQSRLSDTAVRLDEMSKELDQRMARAQVNLHERLARSTLPGE